MLCDLESYLCSSGSYIDARGDTTGTLPRGGGAGVASFRATLAHQHHCSRGECWPASCRPQSRLIAALVVCVRSAPLQKENAPPLALTWRKPSEPVGWANWAITVFSIVISLFPA